LLVKLPKPLHHLFATKREGGAGEARRAYRLEKPDKRELAGLVFGDIVAEDEN